MFILRSRSWDRWVCKETRETMVDLLASPTVAALLPGVSHAGRRNRQCNSTFVMCASNWLELACMLVSLASKIHYASIFCLLFSGHVSCEWLPWLIQAAAQQIQPLFSDNIYLNLEEQTKMCYLAYSRIACISSDVDTFFSLEYFCVHLYLINI